MTKRIAWLALILVGCSWPDKPPAPAATSPAATPVVQATTAKEALQSAQNALQRGQTEQYVQRLKQALQFDPDYQPALAELGMVQGATGDFRASMATLTRACQLDPADVTARLNLAAAKIKLGDSKGGLQELRTVRKQEPNNPRSYSMEGSVLASQGQDAQAIFCYSRAYSLSRDATVLFNRGNCHLRLGHQRLAQDDYEMVIAESSNPKLVESARGNLSSIQSGKPVQQPSRAASNPSSSSGRRAKYSANKNSTASAMSSILPASWDMDCSPRSTITRASALK